MLTFEPEEHKYFWDGKPIPCVSDILTRVGFSNFEGMDKETLKLYADFGTEIHLCLEHYDNGVLDEENIDSIVHPILGYTGRPYIKRWQWFLEKYKVTILEVEKHVVSLDYWYAGTFDRMAIVDGELAIVEIKTGHVKKSHRLQTAAYSLACGKILPRYHVYLNPEISEEKSIKIWKNTQQDIDGFKNALGLLEWRANKNIIDDMEVAA